jgi:hypothetical protein
VIISTVWCARTRGCVAAPLGHPLSVKVAGVHLDEVRRLRGNEERVEGALQLDDESGAAGHQQRRKHNEGEDDDHDAFCAENVPLEYAEENHSCTS